MGKEGKRSGRRETRREGREARREGMRDGGRGKRAGRRGRGKERAEPGREGRKRGRISSCFALQVLHVFPRSSFQSLRFPFFHDLKFVSFTSICSSLLTPISRC